MLIVICVLESMSSHTHLSSLLVELEVLNVGPLKQLHNDNDQVTLNLEFIWSTKQLHVFVVVEYWNFPSELNQITL